MKPRHGEEGTVTAFVVIFTFALVMLAGLVLDGGLALAAKVQAVDEAQAAARAGAQAVDVPLLRSTGQDALAYLATTGHTGVVQVDGNEVEVSVTITQPMQILGLGGIGSITVTGRGSAVPAHGVYTGAIGP
jgi:hypothetical protein